MSTLEKPQIEQQVQNIIRQLEDLPDGSAILGVGIPGSGKTTVLSKVADFFGFTYISQDKVREDLTGDPTNQLANKEMLKEVNRRVQLSLEMGRSAIVDATHAETYLRRDAVKKCRSIGAKAVVAVFFDVPLEVAKERNAKRARNVPEWVINKKYEELSSSPPSEEDDFDSIIVVKSQ